jgi:LysR family transcriptional regulator, nitrogen assimilation regulatory protein
MDLKQLEYFVRVAELGSFTRASAALNIAQPALSRQVRLLEVELRQSLLVRNGRGAVPTEAGRLLIEHGRGILHQVERAREELARARGGLAGRVAVGLPTSVAKVLTVPLTRAFRAALPDATLAVSEGLSVAMHDSLVTGRLDIVMLYNAAPSPDMDLQHLLTEDLYLVQAAAHAKGRAQQTLPLAELANFELVIPTRPNAIRCMVDSALAALGLRLQIGLEIDGVAAILDLVADGAGCAVLPLNAVSTSGKPQVFTVRPITGLKSQLSMATSAQRPATLTQRAVQELLVKLMGQHFGQT